MLIAITKDRPIALAISNTTVAEVVSDKEAVAVGHGGGGDGGVHGPSGSSSDAGAAAAVGARGGLRSAATPGHNVAGALVALAVVAMAALFI